MCFSASNPHNQSLYIEREKDGVDLFDKLLYILYSSLFVFDCLLFSCWLVIGAVDPHCKSVGRCRVPNSGCFSYLLPSQETRSRNEQRTSKLLIPLALQWFHLRQSLLWNRRITLTDWALDIYNLRLVRTDSVQWLAAVRSSKSSMLGIATSDCQTGIVRPKTEHALVITQFQSLKLVYCTNLHDIVHWYSLMYISHYVVLFGFFVFQCFPFQERKVAGCISVSPYRPERQDAVVSRHYAASLQNRCGRWIFY